MSNRVSDVLSVLEQLAPAHLAEKWDNVGLQTGSRSQSIDAVLIALDVSMAVLKEASAEGCGMIISHHPLIFTPIKSVSDETAAGSLVLEAGRLGLSVASVHTNLDSAKGGLADMAAEIIGLAEAAPLMGADTTWSKLVTFVPREDLRAVREALFAAGAGVIGDYSHCSYYSEGTGTFLPSEGAKPAVGEIGSEEEVEELRLELVFPTQRVENVIAALTEAHSYEEPAYDIYPLATRSHDAGAGRIGPLARPAVLGDLAASVAESFDMDHARYCGDPTKPIDRVAVVTGSGAGYIREAAGRADALVTGDIRYHDLILAEESGLALIEVPHDTSEIKALERWTPSLEQVLSNLGIQVKFTATVGGRWQRASAGGRGAAAKEELEEDLSERKDTLHQLHVDGGSRGNPGPAGIGVVLTDGEGSTLATVSEFIGEATNNVAEYRALIEGLKLALERDVNILKIFSDSELVVRQLGGSYRVKNEGLRPYYNQAKKLLERFASYELVSVPRKQNDHADELVNKALDEAGH